ncbi:TPA: MobA/MobL family protein [Salmonella enterica]|uniref:MobA/MobL family protein n=1 Tax=Salmonella enterica TaxID=28901 RepID=A0A758K1N0_SALER|nr:MobA/MobL family protein [Salmonella enterica]
MAIFHLSVKTFSRSKGQSATASVAYRAGEKIKCDREGRTHDYTKKGGVLHSEIFLPPNAPSWANDRQQLWNQVEKAEKRKNSTVAREFEVALPYELDKEQRIALVQDFAKQIVERHGCAVDAHLHDDDKRTVKANHHAHIMLTTRKLEQDGFTDKTRELDQKQSGEIVYWREQWAKTVNKHLWEHGIDKQVDHRSLKEQGLEREPTIKMGVNASALERKGVKTERGDYNRAIKSYDPDKINKHLTTQFKQAEELYNKLQFIEKRLPEVKRDIADKQPSLYRSLDDMGISTAPPEERTIHNEQSETTTDRSSSRMVEQVTPERNSDERERRLLSVSKQESHKLGKGHTEEVGSKDSSISSTTSGDKLSDLQTNLSISEKRNLIKSFNEHIDKQAKKLLDEKLKKIREHAKLLSTEIEDIKSEKPLIFGKKEWQEKLDIKVEKYNRIREYHNYIESQGVTKEIRTDALRNYYLERPDAYDSIQAMDEEVGAFDKEQAQRELEQRQKYTVSRRIMLSNDKGMDR